jgi:hypothetical protein
MNEEHEPHEDREEPTDEELREREPERDRDDLPDAAARVLAGWEGQR